MLRQGLGGHHFAFAFARFRKEDSYEGMRPFLLVFSGVAIHPVLSPKQF
jgi:hypothetical protein